jgi:ATP-dependent helicase HepA
VLLDLPSNPDLLEQRIGRLDRIGQKSTIEIHVPYVSGGQEEVLYRWYKEGLNSFEKTCPAAAVLRAEFAQQLQEQLNKDSLDNNAIDKLVANTQSRLAEINADLEKGRDRLLELSSYRKEDADKLKQTLESYDDYAELDYYLELACDGFGIDMEHHSDHTHILNPGSHYRGGFKDISDEGITVTLDRTTALSNEDFKYLTWEHPLITDSFDQVLSSSMGNAALGTIDGTEFPAGTLLTECLFTVHSIAPKSLQLGRYLPPQLFRIVIDNKLQFVSKQLPFNSVKAQVKRVERNTTKQIIDSQKPLLEKMILRAQAVANSAKDNVIKSAKDKLDKQLKPEVDRLRYLKTINPSVRDDEITALSDKYDQSELAIEHAVIKLDGVRALITT